MLFVFFISCENKIEKRLYYTTGELERIDFYKTKNDSFPISSITYYKNGLVKDSNFYDIKGKLSGIQYYNSPENNYYRWANFSNDLKNGEQQTYKYNGEKIITNYKNGNLYGIASSYDSLGFLFEEYLYIDGSALAFRMFDIIPKGDTISQEVLISGIDELQVTKMIVNDEGFRINSFYKKVDNRWNLIGTILFYKDEVYDNKNSYYEIKYQKYICCDRNLKVEINKHHKSLNDTYLEVILTNEIDINFNLKDTTLHIVGEANNSKLEFNINDLQLGKNLILGKVFLKNNNTIIKEYLLFEEVIVNDSYSQ